MLSSSADNKTAFGISLFKRSLNFFSLLRPYNAKMSFGALLIIITNMIAVLLPYLVNKGVAFIEGKKTEKLSFGAFTFTVEHLSEILIVIFILAIVGAIIRTLSRVQLFDVGRFIERDLRAQVLEHVSALDDKFYRRHQVGDIMSHLTNDISNVRMMTGFAVLQIINIIVIFLLSIPFLLRIDTLLACCALLPFPLVMVATRGLSKRMFEATKNYQEKLAMMVNHVQENLGGAQVVRLFHQQENEGKRFSSTNKTTFVASIKLARLRVLMFPTMRLVIGLALALVLWVGGKAVLANTISVGDFVEINARILQLTWPAMSVGFVISILTRGKASLSRLNALLMAQSTIIDGALELSSISALDVVDLKLKSMLSFSLKKGEMLGVVGPSGSYKSTLLKTLYRRIPVLPGTIFINGHDIITIKLASLYEQMAVVNQEPFLFHKSIKENICLLAPNASDAEIEQVLRIVQLDKDIKNFPAGLETMVGERGITLSGGQRQRIALARALLAKKSLLILDDALSAVDSETEAHIMQELASLKDAIIIIATHRLSAIKNATQIIVLEKGAMAAMGRHAQLMESSHLYRQLWGSYE